MDLPGLSLRDRLAPLSCLRGSGCPSWDTREVSPRGVFREAGGSSASVSGWELSVLLLFPFLKRPSRKRGAVLSAVSVPAAWCQVLAPSGPGQKTLA